MLAFTGSSWRGDVFVCTSTSWEPSALWISQVLSWRLPQASPATSGALLFANLQEVMAQLPYLGTLAPGAHESSHTSRIPRDSTRHNQSKHPTVGGKIWVLSCAVLCSFSIKRKTTEMSLWIKNTKKISLLNSTFFECLQQWDTKRKEKGWLNWENEIAAPAVEKQETVMWQSRPYADPGDPQNANSV